MPRRPAEPPQITVQRLSEAFNKQDMETIASLIAPNCVVAALKGGTETVGAPSLAAEYAAMFEDRPKARLAVMGRMALGETVVQHETISRGLAVLEKRIAIYTVLHEKVARLDLIR